MTKIVPVSVSMDERIRKAIQKLAKNKFTSFSQIIVQAVIKYLKENGIDI